jgi:hypothetical protein
MKIHLRSKGGADFLSLVTLFLAISTVGMKWIPLVKLGGITLEISNIVQLLMIFVFFPIFLVKKKLIAHSSTFMNLLLALIVLMTFVLFIRGDGYATGILRLSIFSLVSSYVLINIDSRALVLSKYLVPLALITFITVIIYSFYLAGVDFFLEVKNYLITQDRVQFVYGSIRPALNAFSAASKEGDLEYLASIINAIAGVFTLFFILSSALSNKHGNVMLISAAISLFFVFVLFSLSALLICVITGLIFIAHYIRHTNISIFKLLISLVVIPVLIINFTPLFNFVYSAILDNQVSTAHRVNQYMNAAELLNKSPFLGSGYVLIDGFQIHNLLVFTWVSGGVFLFFGVFVVYLIAIALIIEGIYGSLIEGSKRVEYLLMATLPVIFLIRCSVGGAGGLPAGSSSIAIALALLAKRNLMVNKI